MRVSFNTQSMLLAFSITLILSACQKPSPYQPTSQERAFISALDSVASKLQKDLGVIPGFTIGVVKGQNELAARAYGMADMERNLPVTAQTHFYIASMTKAFTGLMAAVKSLENAPGLETPLSELFPDSNFENIDPEPITVRNLLTHTFGFDNGQITKKLSFTGEYDHDLLLRLLTQTSPSDSLGVYRYSNLGYNVYAIALQEKYGQYWKTELESTVLKPLGMFETSTYMSDVGRHDWTMAMPYLGVGSSGNIERGVAIKTDTIMQSAGGLISTIGDMNRWLIAHINQGMIDGKQVLPKRAFEIAHTPFVQKADFNRALMDSVDYALGWEVLSDEIYSHAGGFAGYGSLMTFDRSSGLGISIMCNEGMFASFFAYTITHFALEWWKDKNFTKYDALREQLIQLVQILPERARQDMASRAQRTWNLTLDKSAYTGKYQDDYQGTVNVELAGDTFRICQGIQCVIAEPYTVKNSARVSFDGMRGRALQFYVSRGTVDSLKVDGEVFRKIDEE